ncbi:MAG: hypothetical protein LC689_20095, partial [Myxococcales bacterium]|nr:hypothetical protein [Myxococcales bacterium]
MSTAMHPVDVVALKPRDREQLRLLADRLEARLPGAWLRTLRWAGRALLASHADDIAAERILSAAKEAGVKTLVLPSHADGRMERFVADNS